MQEAAGNSIRGTVTLQSPWMATCVDCGPFAVHIPRFLATSEALVSRFCPRGARCLVPEGLVNHANSCRRGTFKLKAKFGADSRSARPAFSM